MPFYPWGEAVTDDEQDPAMERLQAENRKLRAENTLFRRKLRQDHQSKIYVVTHTVVIGVIADSAEDATQVARKVILRQSLSRNENANWSYRLVGLEATVMEHPEET